MQTPRIAIIDTNALAAIGLKQLLHQVMPFAEIDTVGSMAELDAHGADDYFHYFVAINMVLQHRAFFMERRRKTIVLTTQTSDDGQLSEFHCLCVNQPESHLVRQLLELEQHAHGGGRNLPMASTEQRKSVLSDREIEVMTLIVRGMINKEIADRLNIGLSTVVTHRRNIMEKLGLKSVSALTIYAVMHGYVDIDHI